MGQGAQSHMGFTNCCFPHREESEDAQAESMGQVVVQTKPEGQEVAITVQDIPFEVGGSPESSLPVQATPSDHTPSDRPQADGTIPVKKPRARRSKFKAAAS